MCLPFFMTKILYKVPSRQRPVKLIATIKNIIDFAQHDDYVILVTLDEDDEVCVNDLNLYRELAKYEKVISSFGEGTGSKVEACNRDMHLVKDWDILFLVSDDGEFVVKGFDKIVIGLFEVHFKNKMGVLHSFDGTTNHRQITMAIFNKEWYDHFGFIYNPAYVSLYCDTEMKAVAETIGAYHMEPIVLNKHLHPAWNLAPRDALYERNEHPELYRHDCETYNNRRRINFEL